MIKFEDETMKMVDLEKYLDKGIFVPLRKLEEFRKFKVNSDTDTIEWENGADLSPDFLYDIGTMSSQASSAA